MTEPYPKFVALADRLITKFGKSVTLFNTTREPADETQPWNGPATWDDATASPEQKVTVTAVFIGELLAGTHGEITGVSRSTLGPYLTDVQGDIFLVSGSCPQNLANFDKLLDDGAVWNIDNVVTIKPANVAVLYAIQVSK